MNRRQFLKLAAATVAALFLPKVKTVEAETPTEPEREVFDFSACQTGEKTVFTLDTRAEGLEWICSTDPRTSERPRWGPDLQGDIILPDAVRGCEFKPKIVHGDCSTNANSIRLWENFHYVPPGRLVNTGYIDQIEGVPCGAIDLASPGGDHSAGAVSYIGNDGQLHAIVMAAPDPSFDAMVEDIERRMRQAFAMWYCMPRLSLDDIFTGYEDVDA